MVFSWSDTADKQMLLRIMHLAGPVKLADFDQVAAGMPPGVTAEACRQRLRRIKKQVSDSESSKETTTTPVKRGVATKKIGGAKQKAQKSALGAEAGEWVDDDEGDDEEESPFKKSKIEKDQIKSESKVKSERKLEDEDDEDDWLV